MRPRGTKFSTYAVKSGELAAREWAAKQRDRGVHLPQLRLFDRTAFPRAVVDIEVPDGDGTVLTDIIPGREDPSPRFPVDFWDRAVAGLPPREARCVVGYYRDGLTHAELGEELGYSRGRIEQLVRSGERIIRETGTFAKYMDNVV